MKIGYARVSTEDQHLDRQIEALKNYGAEKIYTEKMTGTKADRPELNKMIEHLREGDIIVIESLSRLGRSTKNLIELMERFNSLGVNVVSLKENIDTTTATGKLMFTMISAFAQFERDIIAERTKEGLKSARARGKVGGRKKKDSSKVETALTLYDSQRYSVSEIENMTGVSKATLYRRLKDRKQRQG